jgi:hypothetical protein
MARKAKVTPSLMMMGVVVQELEPVTIMLPLYLSVPQKMMRMERTSVPMVWKMVVLLLLEARN